MCRWTRWYHGPTTDKLFTIVNKTCCTFVIKFAGLLKTSEDRDVWDHYDEGTLSIEIVKDGKIQKIHFRCKEKVMLD